MRPTARRLSWIVLGLLASAVPVRGQYQQSILVVDPTQAGNPGVTAHTLMDPNLKDPWGFSFTKTSPFWISDQASNVLNADGTTRSGVSTLVGVNQSGVPSPNGLIVNVPNLGNAPPSGDVTNGPTGQVSPGAVGITAGANDFKVGTTGPANFIFANLDGSISAWKGGVSGTLASTETSVQGASFTGLAIGNAAATSFGNASGSGVFLYAADQNSSSLDVFNNQWSLVGQLTHSGAVALPAGFTAFNVQNIGGILYVTFADSGGGVGGIVDEFSTDGTFIKTLINDPTGKWLDQPWGVALAPGNFGALSNDLLVGNNDDAGWINAFNATTGTFVSTLMIGNTPFSASGLWGLEFGNGGTGNNGPASTLFFTAGPDDSGGIFGSISAVPEPTSLALIGLGGVAALSLRRRLGRRG